MYPGWGKKLPKHQTDANKPATFQKKKCERFMRKAGNAVIERIP